LQYDIINEVSNCHCIVEMYSEDCVNHWQMRPQKTKQYQTDCRLRKKNWCNAERYFLKWKHFQKSIQFLFLIPNTSIIL